MNSPDLFISRRADGFVIAGNSQELLFSKQVGHLTARTLATQERSDEFENNGFRR